VSNKKKGKIQEGFVTTKPAKKRGEKGFVPQKPAKRRSKKS